jgi:hypothetical protein
MAVLTIDTSNESANQRVRTWYSKMVGFQLRAQATCRAEVQLGSQSLPSEAKVSDEYDDLRNFLVTCFYRVRMLAILFRSKP